MLQKILSKISKEEEILLKLASEENIKYYPVNHIGLEYLITKPGLPHTKIIQIAGFADSGKTLLTSYFASQFQRYYEERGIVIWIDTERAFSPDFYKSLGGNLEMTGIYQPKTLEGAFNYIKDVISNIRKDYPAESYPILIVIDSLSLAVEKELNEASVPVGTYARELSSQFRRLRSLLPEWGATLIYISQNKEKISMMPWGGGVARLGGHAVEFAPILTLDIKKIGAEKEEKDARQPFTDISKVRFKVKAEKNHLGIAFREIELVFSVSELTFKEEYNLFEMCLAKGIIQRKGDRGGWFEFEGKSYRFNELLEILSNKKEDLKKELREYFKILYNEDIIWKPQS